MSLFWLEFFVQENRLLSSVDEKTDGAIGGVEHNAKRGPWNPGNGKDIFPHESVLTAVAYYVSVALVHGLKLQRQVKKLDQGPMLWNFLRP